ncbi:RNA-directed DNA polymerase from mobile element jockey-like protein [Willisornis vidua]|uniref:RNA-directed DNA polymerase from mobile element jockey-like protein n=1 Tax=Willisornis vidua TaxID=1566151 RepID=A0ABQ9CSN7_9PASS|nr:RNA-directed DNA polymerase from mobile element jockey-like protein [Willisornis vidua]
MGPDGMDPQVLRQLMNIIAMSLMILFERSWFQEGCLRIERTQMEDSGNYWSLRLTSAPGKKVESHFGGISTHTDHKQMIRTSQHGFTKGKSCLANLIAFYNETTSWLDEGRTVGIICLSFSKAFNTVSCNILTGKLKKTGLDQWTVRWFGNWLNGRT